MTSLPNTPTVTISTTAETWVIQNQPTINKGTLIVSQEVWDRLLRKNRIEDLLDRVLKEFAGS